MEIINKGKDKVTVSFTLDADLIKDFKKACKVLHRKEDSVINSFLWDYQNKNGHFITAKEATKYAIEDIETITLDFSGHFEIGTKSTLSHIENDYKLVHFCTGPEDFGEIEDKLNRLEFTKIAKALIDECKIYSWEKYGAYEDANCLNGCFFMLDGANWEIVVKFKDQKEYQVKGYCPLYHQGIKKAAELLKVNFDFEKYEEDPEEDELDESVCIDMMEKAAAKKNNLLNLN